MAPRVFGSDSPVVVCQILFVIYCSDHNEASINHVQRVSEARVIQARGGSERKFVILRIYKNAWMVM